MGRKRKTKGRPVSGWLILDKPAHLGSTDAVSRIKRLFDAAKAGHAGTLDPLASGMLPIALGDATKTVPYVMEGAKTYRFTVTWGQERAGDDREGEIVAKTDLRPSRGTVEDLLEAYTGRIEQVPPQFSAVRINGARAYDLARSGELVDIPARKVIVHRLALIEWPDDNSATFEMECGKGTYVRSLARDMGRDLGCYGHISQLRRLDVAPFAETSMISLEALEALEPLADIEGADPFGHLDQHLTGAASALSGLDHLTLGAHEAGRLRNGKSLLLLGRDAPISADAAYATLGGQLVAIGAIEKGEFHPRRVFAG